MLELKQITKTYQTGTEQVEALKGISLAFRDCEFVSILGQSGCGKTTLLNIIGGLDRYTTGDLVINGKSTKHFTAKDWDRYRNHSVGFVFQSYNLIPHQTVLSNVELALTLSGVSKEERRKRAVAVLEKVGLKDQIHKKPNQMSGGQMQRVAIARALVNDPDILLADEPTGALDSETSVQIMELIQEISKDKLVIMVTHNPDLAEQYSTRTIRLLDGKVVDDNNPYQEEKTANTTQEGQKGSKKASMFFLTALSLSLHNLITKKGRTFLTAFAGSIGIIGIALILSLSNGVQSYIDQIEEDTLSSYPIQIDSSSLDMTVMMEAFMGAHQKDDAVHDDGKIHSTPMMNDMLDTLSSKRTNNNLTEFKSYLDSNGEIQDLSNSIQYRYGLDLNIYNENGVGGIVQTSPNQLLNKMGFGEMVEMGDMMGTSEMSSNEVWDLLIDNQELLEKQYDLVAGTWPSSYNEVVLQVDENENISDYTLYSLGLMDQDQLIDNFNALMEGKEVSPDQQVQYSYDELLDTSFKIILNTDYYAKENGIWVDKSQDEAYMESVIANAEELKIVGIIKPGADSVSSSMTGCIGYTGQLEEHLIQRIRDTDIAKEQLADPEINVFTGLAFPEESGSTFDLSSLSAEEKAQLASLSEEERMQLMAAYQENSSATYEDNLKKLGIADLDSPTSIQIYAKDFDSKEQIADLITQYNQEQTDAGQEENVISYSDLVGTMIRSVSSVIDTVSYVLIAFVGVSLVVSSIMIGIITYISVLERTKEIGILRSIGASKKDVARVFNAETLIIGLFAGVLGIAVTCLLNIPINLIVENALDVSGIASLPVIGAVILIVISMCLTLIAGLIPSKIASRKDPVVALRTE